MYGRTRGNKQTICIPNSSYYAGENGVAEGGTTGGGRLYRRGDGEKGRGRERRKGADVGWWNGREPGIDGLRLVGGSVREAGQEIQNTEQM